MIFVAKVTKAVIRNKLGRFFESVRSLTTQGSQMAKTDARRTTKVSVEFSGFDVSTLNAEKIVKKLMMIATGVARLTLVLLV